MGLLSYSKWAGDIFDQPIRTPGHALLSPPPYVDTSFAPASGPEDAIHIVDLAKLPADFLDDIAYNFRLSVPDALVTILYHCELGCNKSVNDENLGDKTLLAAFLNVSKHDMFYYHFTRVDEETVRPSFFILREKHVVKCGIFSTANPRSRMIYEPRWDFRMGTNPQDPWELLSFHAFTNGGLGEIDEHVRGPRQWRMGNGVDESWTNWQQAWVWIREKVWEERPGEGGATISFLSWGDGGKNDRQESPDGEETETGRNDKE